MEVLDFQVKGKHISKQGVECGANVRTAFGFRSVGVLSEAICNAAASLTLDT
jgi:hypothetical protein